MDREALAEPLKVALLTLLAITVLAPLLLLVQEAQPGLRLDPHSTKMIPQSDFVDFNSRIYLNSTACPLKVNGLPILTIREPILVTFNCAITPLNSTWVRLVRRAGDCMIFLNPIFVPKNSTLIFFDTSDTGWADRICYARTFKELRIYSPSIEICGFRYSASGAVTLRIVHIEVRKC